MRRWLEQILDAVIAGFNLVVAVVRDVVQGALGVLWGIVKYCVEFVWNWTIGIAEYTLANLVAAIGFNFDLDFSAWEPYLEAANYWVPVSEFFAIAQMMYAFYLFVFAYRFIKWALPFN